MSLISTKTSLESTWEKLGVKAESPFVWYKVTELVRIPDACSMNGRAPAV